MANIRVKNGDSEINIGLEFIDNPTARRIEESLPVESLVNTWGDEIYFETDITASSKGATLDVSIGDVAYWPGGKCLCIFFGRTPNSTGDKPMPAGEVVIVGRVKAQPDVLRKIKPASRICVE